MTAANVRRGRCRYDCSSTWHGEHGGSLPGGPFPGTYGGSGDVRLCKHGRVWEYAGTYESAFFCWMDRWERVSRLRFAAYRRAVQALRRAWAERIAQDLEPEGSSR